MSVVLDQMPDLRAQAARDLERMRASMERRIAPVVERARRLWPVRTGFSRRSIFVEGPRIEGSRVVLEVGNSAPYAVFIGAGGRYGGVPYVDPVTGKLRKPRRGNLPGQTLLIDATRRASESMVRDIADLLVDGGRGR